MLNYFQMSKNSKIKPEISVVMGVYNQVNVIEKVLKSYEEQTIGTHAFEVILVDSESTDGTTELIKNLDASYSLRVIVQKNQGKGEARNTGVREAKSDLILITDADMIADKQLLQTHVNAHKESKEPSIFEGKTFNLKTLEWPTEEKNMYSYIKNPPRNKKKIGWWYCLTGNLSLSKQIFESEGGFSRELNGYGYEDLELGYRFNKKRIPLRFLSNAINYHYHIVDNDEKLKIKEKAGKSGRIFIKLHPELKRFIGINPISVFLFKQIKKRGKLYTYIEEKLYKSKNQFKHKLGFYILQKFFYLKGLLD